MSATLSIDKQLLDKPRHLTGLIEREGARRLAKLGGTEPQLKPVLRREVGTE